MITNIKKIIKEKKLIHDLENVFRPLLGIHKVIPNLDTAWNVVNDDKLFIYQNRELKEYKVKSMVGVDNRVGVLVEKTHSDKPISVILVLDLEHQCDVVKLVNSINKINDDLREIDKSFLTRVMGIKKASSVYSQLTIYEKEMGMKSTTLYMGLSQALEECVVFQYPEEKPIEADDLEIEDFVDKRDTVDTLKFAMMKSSDEVTGLQHIKLFNPEYDMRKNDDIMKKHVEKETLRMATEEDRKIRDLFKKHDNSGGVLKVNGVYNHVQFNSTKTGVLLNGKPVPTYIKDNGKIMIDYQLTPLQTIQLDVRLVLEGTKTEILI